LAPVTNLYAHHFEHPTAVEGRMPEPKASGLASGALAAATAYLDGKPGGTARHPITAAQRDAAFWTCEAWREVPIDNWRSAVLTLALSRYFMQAHTSNIELMTRLAEACPAVLVKAVRHSGLVLCPAPERRVELEQLGPHHPEIAELCRVLHVFAQAHLDRVRTLEALRAPFAAASPFELLILASLYAFERLVPQAMAATHREDGTASADQTAWYALNDIFLWKLGSSAVDAFALDEASIGNSLVAYLAPVLQGAVGSPDHGHAARSAFCALVEAQVELNEFVSRFADAFSYDDGVRFVRHGTALEIVEVDAALRAAWWRDGRKLARLHVYWFHRGIDVFALSGKAAETIGRPENHEANRLAYIRALRTHLQLTEVYGIADTVTTDAGDPVDLFQALLSLELMSAFFQRDFLEAFAGHLRDAGDWRTALGRLAAEGVSAGLQNRFPLTWSDRSAKIANITGWTVNAASPQGDPAMAGAILDFWTSDWAALAAQLQASRTGLAPGLLERPVLRFGQLLVQLPWHVGLQNNSTAAINNLRRLGQRRGQAQEETRRIEVGLGRALAARGFCVVPNWMPERAIHRDAGEVDLVCAMDGVVLVLEVKSTFLRMSQKEAFLHGTTTLRKAGLQLRRKVAAVAHEIASAPASALAQSLGLSLAAKPPTVLGWIVDTSIECDHQRFAGFLKVSLEEVLIALRDDIDLLRDPGDPDPSAVERTLYPAGFSAQSFIEVVESEAVWQGI